MKSALVVSVMVCVGVLGRVVCGQEPAFEDCGSASELQAVAIEGCTNPDTSCNLARGMNTTFQISFVASKPITSVKTIVHGVILEVPVPFGLENPDGCVDSGLNCPLAANENYTYIQHLPVKDNYPRMTLDVKWELQDEDGNDIVCLLIPVKLT